ncbi:hypothetical protein TNCV_5044871 [Trichonephila clavipes]|uniref:Uncharacterized protein n=1 Tax=Trichonephila clavipes TaxID=2585209 RepID=A0A8X6WIF0_TRICX|nr:hypothetical protein TNCV_5044871 [Trichonephila clavipes]
MTKDAGTMCFSVFHGSKTTARLKKRDPTMRRERPHALGTNRQEIKGIGGDYGKPGAIYFSLELPESPRMNENEGGLKIAEFRVSNSTVEIESASSYKLGVKLPKSEEFL